MEEEVWVDSQDKLFTFCLGAAPTGLQVDPDDEVLFAENRLVQGPEDVTLTCGELPEETDPAEEPQTDFEIYGEGQTSVTVGNCSTPVRGVRWGLLGLAGALALRRRR